MRGSKGLGTDLSGKASSFLPLSMLAVGFCSYFLSKVFPSPGDLPNPGIELRSPAFQVNSLLFEPVRKLLIKLREFSPIPTLLRVFFFFLIMNGYWIFLSFFLAGSMRDLSFVTRDQICAPCSGSRSPYHWTVRNYLDFSHDFSATLIFVLRLSCVCYA